VILQNDSNTLKSVYVSLAGGVEVDFSAAGPFLGRLITQEMVFYINLPVGAAALLSIVLFFHEGHK
jgi:hypothetical protein